MTTQSDREKAMGMKNSEDELMEWLAEGPDMNEEGDK
jgi:hypothetical protein